jgi:4-amino-4-deoxy-L-arabinose transferase-like glycosyltransferase
MSLYRFRRFIALAIILLFAAWLRTDRIRQPYVDAFSWRQSSTAMIAENFYQHSFNIFYPAVSWTGPTPGIQGREFQTVTFIAAVAYKWLGTRDWIGRAVCVAFGLWGIFAFFQLVKLVSGYFQAIVAAALLAMMPGPVFIDRSFLPDPAMTSLMISACWFLALHLRTGRGVHLVLAAVAGIWGALTKLPGMIVGMPMIYVVLRHGRDHTFKYYHRFLVLALLALMIVSAYYLWAIHLARSHPPYHFAGHGNWIWNHGFASWMKEAYFISQFLGQVDFWLWTMPVFMLAIMGLIVPLIATENKPNRQPAPWFFHWWLAAMICYFIIGARELIHNPWNFHLFSPAIAGLAASAIVYLGELSRKYIVPSWPLPPILSIITLILELFCHNYLIVKYRILAKK